jgi:hypothetical protein
MYQKGILLSTILQGVMHEKLLHMRLLMITLPKCLEVREREHSWHAPILLDNDRQVHFPMKNAEISLEIPQKFSGAS